MIRNYQIGLDEIYRPNKLIINHRNQEYNINGFSILLKMQEKHFWYKGRHKFIFKSLDRFLPKKNSKISMIDLGGGAGGWSKELSVKYKNKIDRIALADSSLVALEQAKNVVPNEVLRCQIDLMNLQMENEWDVAFLLDVIEHLPFDSVALEQTNKALKPGGLLFVTTPAFKQFWSYNDDFSDHQRRYTQVDFERLAKASGFKMIDSRFFMFFLSPIYFLSRFKPGLNKLSKEEIKKIVLKQHQIPIRTINTFLETIFKLESPIGNYIIFPWGTSILGIFQKQ